MPYNLDRPYTFDRVIRLLISIILFAAGVYLTYILRNVLLPFLIAWLIAYLLNPLVRIIEKKLHLKRVFAVILTFILVLGLFFLLYICIAPSVQKEVEQINILINTYRLDSSGSSGIGIPVSVYDFIQKYIDYDYLVNNLTKDSTTETIKYLIPALKGILSSSISFILGLGVIFIVVLYIIFILLDYDKINVLWTNLIPHKYRGFINKLTIDVEKSMNTYFRHQAIICLIVAFLYCVAFQIIGLPLAILMGLFIGVLHMVPYLHAISIIPATILCWLKVSQTGQHFWAYLGIILLIYVIIQCIIDIILVPRIMGKAMGLNPAIILLSLSIWGALLGILGMIIAIPMTTLLLSYYQSFLSNVSDKRAQALAEKQDEEIKAK